MRRGGRMQALLKRGVFGGRRTAAFSPSSLSPALWLEADPAYCYTDGAVTGFSGADFLGVANNATLQTGNVDCWWTGWVYLNSSASDQAIISKVGGAVGEYLIYVPSGGTSIRLIFYGGGGTVGATVTSDATGTAGWHFFVVYHKASTKEIAVSVDGGAFGSVNYTGVALAVTDDVGVGIRRVVNDFAIDGRISGLAFGKPTSGDMATIAVAIRDSLYASGAGKVYADLSASEKTTWGLVSYWEFTRSGNYLDSHGSNNLTETGTVGFAAGKPYAACVANDPVAKWVDRSGNGVVFTQTNAGKRPTFKLVSGKYLVRADGVNDSMSSGNVSLGAFTLVAAHKASAGLLLEHSGNSGDFPGSYLNPSGGGHANVNRSSSLSAFDVTANLVDDAYRVLTQTFDGTNAGHKLYSDGTLLTRATTFSSSDPGTGSVSDQLFLFSRNSGSIFLAGDLAALILATPQLSDANRLLLEAYAAAKNP